MDLVAGQPWIWTVMGWINGAVLIVVLVIEIVAFVNCLTQRAEAFPVVGSISKGGWLAITGGAVFFTVVLSPLLGGAIGIIGMIAVAAALVYLLDVRPALRDAVDGHGSW